MLPDFVRVKEKRRRWFIRAVDREAETLTPLLNHVRTVKQHEGRRLHYQTVEGAQDTIAYDKRIATSLKFKLDEVADLSNQAYLEKAKEMAAELAPQAMNQFFKEMDRWTAEAGTVTSAGGRPFEPMMLIECLEKVDVDFDDRGRPQLPALVAGPSQQPAMEKVFADAEKSAEFQRAWGDLMQRKWIEFRDREADRKLVD